MYRKKCGIDVGRFFGEVRELDLYECTATGMRFWRPGQVAGPEEFYRLCSEAWPNYYRSERWEYEPARRAIGSGRRVLEVGCGRGFFLRSLAARGNAVKGLELNADAISSKVTEGEVRRQLVEDLAAAEPASFDVVCSFQVLEHVVDPAGFIRACMALVRPAGLLLFSTPNNEFELHRTMGDAFDLPPHHLNHFTPATLRRIGERLGLSEIDVLTQTTRVPVRALPRAPAASPVTRLVRSAANAALRLAAGTREAPGHTLLAIYRVAAAAR
jgi:SAM-dependent methyltransferase